MMCNGCNYTFENNEGRYNHSDGTLCTDCETNIPFLEFYKKINNKDFRFEKYENLYLEEKIKIGKYIIDGKLLFNYYQAVDQYQFFTTIEVMSDMVLIQNAHDKKEKALKKIFKFVNIQYFPSNSNKSESKKFREQLDNWENPVSSSNMD